MYGQATASGSGVQICVEPLNEWKIQEIGYDGVEKYMKPPEFKDLLRKNANSINWRKLVGDEGSLEAAAVESDQEDTEGQKEEAADKLAQLSKSFVEPVAGPWAIMAKQLHYSLQEVNILLDCLRIATNKPEYLSPVVIGLIQDERAEAEQVGQSKAFHLHNRRKTLSEASRIIEQSLNVRRAGSSCESEKGDFFNELRELRENWRIRKVGPSIFGDLGYKPFAPKFAAHEVFDVTQKSSSSRSQSIIRSGNHSFIDLRLPHNLRYRTQLLVFVQTDNEESAQSLFKEVKRPSTSDEQVRLVHWAKALPWAQDSLICRDILAQLISECVSQQNVITLTTENSIIISLFDSLLLRVETKFHPFQDSKFSEDEGVPYLSHCLRELFLTEHTQKPKRVQQFVTLPLVSHPEGLDMRGPQALSAEEIASRMDHRQHSSVSSSPDDTLFRRFISCASHYVLVNRTIDFLVEKHMVRYSDPQVQWKWIRATANFSMISLNFSSRGFENLGKFSSLIRITDSTITLISKESQQFECRRDMEMLENALLLLRAHFLLNSSQVLSRAYGWQLFHANSNAFDSDGNPAPTLYVCNQSATMHLFVQFHTSGCSPSIFVRDNRAWAWAKKKQQQGSSDLDGFRRLCYRKIPGSTFMRKIDNLLATFIN